MPKRLVSAVPQMSRTFEPANGSKYASMVSLLTCNPANIPHETKVRVVATVGENKSPAGRKVARARNYVSVNGGAPEHQQTQK